MWHEEPSIDLGQPDRSVCEFIQNEIDKCSKEYQGWDEVWLRIEVQAELGGRETMRPAQHASPFRLSTVLIASTCCARDRICTAKVGSTTKVATGSHDIP